MTHAELTSSEPPSLEAIVASLEGKFSVRPGDPNETERVYLDTFDGALRAAGRVLWWEDGRLSLSQDGSGVTAGLAALPTGALPGADLPESGLRTAVLKLIDVRALLPLARVGITAQTYAVLDELEKTVARVEILAPALLVGPSRRDPLVARISLRGVRGYSRELRATEKALSAGLGLTPTTQSLFEEAVLAAGGSPDGVSAKIDVPLEPDERTDAAAARVLRRLLEVIDATRDGTLADTDSEFLHDYRVAIRRTRSVQRELGGAFPPDQLAAMRVEFKWLQEVTGDARDLDVHLLGFEEMRALAPEPLRAELEPLHTVIRHRRLDARRRMVRALRSDRAAGVRADWAALLESLVELPQDDRPDAARPIGEVAAHRIRSVYRKMVKMGEAIGAGSPPEEYHELRKKGKELRYLLELFGTPLHDPGVVKPMVKSLKRLQDVLGHHQDREVQISMLRSLTGEVSALPGGAAALLAMGVLIERLQEDAGATREEFFARFGEFSAEETRTLMKRTFS